MFENSRYRVYMDHVIHAAMVTSACFPSHIGIHLNRGVRYDAVVYNNYVWRFLSFDAVSTGSLVINNCYKKVNKQVQRILNLSRDQRAKKQLNKEITYPAANHTTANLIPTSVMHGCVTTSYNTTEVENKFAVVWLAAG